MRRVFGKLKIIGIAGRGPRGISYLCLCRACGKKVKMAPYWLHHRGYKTCGCGKKWSDKRKPVLPEIREANKLTYVSWVGMLSRCHYARKKHKCYEGITICDEWYDFEVFLRDMGPRPSKEYSLDREKPELGYFKANCRWITKSENCARVRHYLKPAEAYKRAGRKLKRGWATGRIKHSEEGRARISNGRLKRIGRKLQKCQTCGQDAYLPQCQRCRGKRK